jgi:hypothetical protein
MNKYKGVREIVFLKGAVLFGARRVLPVLVWMICALRIYGADRVQPVPVPAELRSTVFTVTVDGKPVDVAHAADRLEFASFDATGPVTVEVTASDPKFWDAGVTVEPWRLGIRPVRKGATLRFTLDGPAKLSIARPRDFLNHASMLFLFAGVPPQKPARAAKLRVFPAGVYHQSLNPQNGETYYLAPGAVFYGSLNLWKVHDVKVLGRGLIVYDGPQNPNTDEGWMQKPDWHCIAAKDSERVEVHGLACVVRSRTWSIQMKDTARFLYDDIRVMGGNPGNANQDGMDWLGGGDAIVRNSFLRASDDVFAMQGAWDGYNYADLVRPGHDVQNILVENSQLSTSISNIVRAGWPQKIYNSRNFTLRNSEVLHAGIGACGQPFAVLGLWGANHARGSHSGYTFENLFLDNWYSLVQIEQRQPEIRNFVFRNIWALDQPPLTDSSLIGNVAGITFDNVKYGQHRAESNADVPVVTTAGAQSPNYPQKHAVTASFTMSPTIIVPGQPITFTAQPVSKAQYTWLFGDGTRATGRVVEHRFPDALGSDYDATDGAGRFRVLLHVEVKRLRQKTAEDWAAQGVVVVGHWKQSQRDLAQTVPGLIWKIYPGTWTQLPDLAKESAVFSGEAVNLHANPGGYTGYAVAWDGFLSVPADGGYTFHLIDRDGARLVIDGVEVAKTGPPFAQVCGAPGNALRYERGELGLRAGKHTIHVEGLHTRSENMPRILWEGPSLPLTDVPPAAYSHTRQDVLRR